MAKRNVSVFMSLNLLVASLLATVACGNGQPGTDADHGSDASADQVMPPNDSGNPADATPDNDAVVITDSGSDASVVTSPDLPPGAAYVEPDLTSSGCFHNLSGQTWTFAGGSGSVLCQRSSGGYIVCSLGNPAGGTAFPTGGWTFSGDRLWDNWSNMDSDVHCWAVFVQNGGTPDCRSLSVACYAAGVDPRSATYSMAIAMAMNPPGPAYGQEN